MCDDVQSTHFFEELVYQSGKMGSDRAVAPHGVLLLHMPENFRSCESETVERLRLGGLRRACALDVDV